MRRAPYPGKVDPIKEHRQLDAIDLGSVVPFGKVNLEMPPVEPLAQKHQSTLLKAQKSGQLGDILHRWNSIKLSVTAPTRS